MDTPPLKAGGVMSPGRIYRLRLPSVAGLPLIWPGREILTIPPGQIYGALNLFFTYVQSKTILWYINFDGH
jgi:hypothetical protein